MKLTKKWTRKWMVGTQALSASISPCSWMYPGYGVQVRIVLEATKQQLFRLEKIAFADATEEVAFKLTEGVELAECACGQPYMKGDKMCDPSATPDAPMVPQLICEKCRMQAIRDKYAAAIEQEKQERAAEDRGKKFLGYRYKLTAWVHPRSGGDDYMLTAYYKDKLGDNTVQQMLKDADSAVLTDYRVEEL